MEVIKSISYNQDEIIKNILKLYNNNQTFELDCCYSKGNFYKNIERPKYCFDIIPQFDYVENVDCRNTYFENGTINSIIYDPPFLATKGKSLKENKNNNYINKRFGVYPTEDELFNFYKDSIVEFSRILKENGLLVIKCQDKVSSSKQYIAHNTIINFCEENGFCCEDLFVLLSKGRLIANWQLENQKHSRKFHCYFLVFRKRQRKNK